MIYIDCLWETFKYKTHKYGVNKLTFIYFQSVSQFDGGRSETDEQGEQLSTCTGSTSKLKTTVRILASTPSPPKQTNYQMIKTTKVSNFKTCLLIWCVFCAFVHPSSNLRSLQDHSEGWSPSQNCLCLGKWGKKKRRKERYEQNQRDRPRDTPRGKTNTPG